MPYLWEGRWGLGPEPRPRPILSLSFPSISPPSLSLSICMCGQKGDRKQHPFTQQQKGMTGLGGQLFPAHMLPVP